MSTSASIIPLRPCVCGAVGDARYLCMDGDDLDMTIFVCKACFVKTEAFLECVRPVFEAMQRVGIPNEDAQATMKFMLDRVDDENGLVEPWGGT